MDMIEGAVKNTNEDSGEGLSPQELIYRIVDEDESAKNESGTVSSDATNFTSCLEYLRKKGKIVF